MTPASLSAVACLASGMLSVPEINTPHIAIPINYDRRRAPDIRTLEVWMSYDRGHSWNRVAAVEPPAGEVRYHLSRDGEYWFGLHIEMKDGHVEPPINSKPDSIRRIRLRTGEGNRTSEQWAVGIDIQLGTKRVSWRMAPASSTSKR